MSETTYSFDEEKSEAVYAFDENDYLVEIMENHSGN